MMRKLQTTVVAANKIATGMKKGRIHVWKTNQTRSHPPVPLIRAPSPSDTLYHQQTLISHLLSIVLLVILVLVSPTAKSSADIEPRSCRYTL